MATPFRTIYSAFLRKIEDSDLPQMSPVDQDQMLLGWLMDALGYIALDKLKIEHDLTNYDIELQEFTDDLTNDEITVLSLYMAAAWYEPRINSLSHTLLFWGSRDEKYTDQTKHLNWMMQTQDRYLQRARKYFRNHSSRSNSYLNGDTNGN